jgi:UDP-glucose 4-epimerase
MRSESRLALNIRFRQQSADVRGLIVRVLVSGAGGFIGRHLAVALACARHDVVALVRRARPAVLDRQTGLRVECADLAHAPHLPVGPFDALVHCAAAIPSQVRDDAELFRINVEGSRRLFEHAALTGADIIIFCSSMAVYGRVDVDIVDADTPMHDANAYGRSKLACERLLVDLSRAHAHLRAVSIRLPGVVGRGSHDNFLSDTMARLVGGETAIVRNPDAPFNNVVHVDDFARFADTLLASLPRGHRAVTIGAETPLPIREVVAIMEAAAGRTGAVRYELGGYPFLISSDHARSFGYRPASVRDSVERFARGRAAELAAAPAGTAGAGDPV